MYYVVRVFGFMEKDKYFEIKAAGLLLVGIILILLTLRNADTLALIGVILIFMMCGYMVGKTQKADEFMKMHYTALEAEAKKRRDKDEELSRKVKQHIKDYEDKHS